MSSLQRQPSGDKEKRIICIPTDGSPNAEKAFQWYLSNMRRDGDELLVVHIIEPPSLPSFSLKSGFNVPTDEWQKIITEHSKRAKQLEEDMSLRSHTLKIFIDFRAVSSKNPGEVICDLASTCHASQVIMGNRGLGPLKRTLLGSVSQYVLNNANVPVTVIPPPPRERTESGGDKGKRRSSITNFFSRRKSESAPNADESVPEQVETAD